MTSPRHAMKYVGALGEQSLFVCAVDQCNREVVIDRVKPRLIVTNEGMADVIHYGTSGHVTLSTNLGGR